MGSAGALAGPDCPFDVSPKSGRQRVQGDKTADRFERESKRISSACGQAYLRRAQENPERITSDPMPMGA